MSSTRSRWLYWVTLIFILTALLALATVLTELVLREIGLGDPVVYEPNPAYGYAPKPNQAKRRLRSARISINESGLRATRSWAAKGSTSKILFVGDSVTYGGSYIDDSETFSELVCQTLKDTVCGNAGVNAYGVLNMVMRTRYDPRVSDADTVVFTVLVGDFGRGLKDSNHAHFYMNEPNRWLPAAEEALNFVASLYPLKGFLSKRGEAVEGARYEAGRRGTTEFGVEVLNAEIDRLRAQGKRVFVFYTPSREEAQGSYDYSTDWRNVALVLSSVQGIIDMTSAFSKAPESYFYDSVHYEIAGHELAAALILEHLGK